ncbi:YczI family protein [Lysinibacillus telephonicus]
MPYTLLLLGIMVLVSGIIEFQENRKVIAIISFLSVEFVFFCWYIYTFYVIIICIIVRLKFICSGSGDHNGNGNTYSRNSNRCTSSLGLCQ